MNCGSLFSVNKKITNLYNKCKLSVYILYAKSYNRTKFQTNENLYILCLILSNSMYLHIF